MAKSICILEEFQHVRWVIGNVDPHRLKASDLNHTLCFSHSNLI